MSAEWALSTSVVAEVGKRPLGVYVHIPWCSHRCGYCDFNTYVPGHIAGANPQTTADVLVAELALVTELLGGSRPTVSTIFVGGGTPTLLPASDLNRILAAVALAFDLDANAEITVEANPETVDLAKLRALRDGGFNRMSVGMQSNVPAVLRALERRHSPGGTVRAIEAARAAGFERLSVDLIYGTVGETTADWMSSVRSAIDLGVDHVSAYGLKIESGSRLGAARRAGAIVDPDPDRQADNYLAADEALSRAGLDWYEISNWAAPGGQCQHNLGYWRGHDWLGFGPGAHSHVAGVRWWNRKHPDRWARCVFGGDLPVESGEVLSAAERRLEAIMLGLRLVEGIALPAGGAGTTRLAAELADEGLVELHQPRAASGAAPGTTPGATTVRVTLTRRGRLLADLVTLRLADQLGEA